MGIDYINIINKLVSENRRLTRKIEKLENDLLTLKTGYDLKFSNISLDDIYNLLLKLSKEVKKNEKDLFN